MRFISNSQFVSQSMYEREFHNDPISRELLKQLKFRGILMNHLRGWTAEKEKVEKRAKQLSFSRCATNRSPWTFYLLIFRGELVQMWCNTSERTFQENFTSFLIYLKRDSDCRSNGPRIREWHWKHSTNVPATSAANLIKNSFVYSSPKAALEWDRAKLVKVYYSIHGRKIFKKLLAENVIQLFYIGDWISDFRTTRKFCWSETNHN